MALRTHPSQKNLPYVLLLEPPPYSVIFGDHFFNSPKFQFLKAQPRISTSTPSSQVLARSCFSQARTLAFPSVDYPLGSKVAKRLDAIGCSISYNSRSKIPLVPYVFYPRVGELAINCDALIIFCSLTDETHHLINKEVLSALGKDGVIINITRGPIIDEKELVWCLVEGEIRGAGLDVFEHEPDVPIEFFALDNIVMSPHKAVFTRESVLLDNHQSHFSA
ncbi:hypothetical protein REPUB_Repub12eG0190900 [Reevesia pubescens]